MSAVGPVMPAPIPAPRPERPGLARGRAARKPAADGAAFTLAPGPGALSPAILPAKTPGAAPALAGPARSDAAAPPASATLAQAIAARRALASVAPATLPEEQAPGGAPAPPEAPATDPALPPGAKAHRGREPRSRAIEALQAALGHVGEPARAALEAVLARFTGSDPAHAGEAPRPAPAPLPVAEPIVEPAATPAADPAPAGDPAVGARVAAADPSGDPERGAGDRGEGRDPRRSAPALRTESRAPGANPYAALAEAARGVTGTIAPAQPDASAPALGTAPGGPTERPIPTHQVTIDLPGDGGDGGRLRVALRGDALHATLTARDPESARRLESGLGDLRQALADRGFSEVRVNVQAPAARAAGATEPARGSDTPRPQSDGGRPDGRREGDLDGSGHDARQRRAAPRRDAER